MRSPPGSPSRAAVPLTAEVLRESALRYLDRYDASVGKLRRFLTEKARKLSGALEISERPEPEELREWIESVLTRFVEAGILDDVRFSERLATSLRLRGLGKRAIEARLRQRGISEEVAVSAVVEADEGCDDSEFVAACRLVKRRKMGHWRSEERRQDHRNRDLAALARAGFGWEVARRAIEGEPRAY